MELGITLFVRELHGGAVLVRVVADPAICVFAEDFEAALLDLSLLLGDRLERTHPRDLHRFLSPDNARFESWWLADALPIRSPLAVPTKAPLAVSAFVSRHKDYDRVYFPTWDLRAWEPAGDALETRALERLREHAEDLTPGELLARRVQKDERVHELTLRFEPAPLAAFTGIHLGADLLPEPLPPEERREHETKKRRVPTPTLEEIGEDLTRRAKDGELPRAAELDALVDRLARELGGADRPAVVLVGPPSIGKTTAIGELAHRLAREGEKGEPLRRMWRVDANRLIAMRSMFSDWRGQTLDTIDEVHASDALWFVGEAYALLDAGKSAQSEDNVAQLSRPHLARRRVRVIAEATTEAWSRLERRDPGFARLFTPVRFEEPDEATSARIARGVAAMTTAKTELEVGDAALSAARELATRYGLAESAHAATLGLLRRAIADRLAEPEPGGVLGRNDLVDTFCRESGMPAELVRDDVSLDLDAVRGFFTERIVGQGAAVQRMVDLVGVIKAGLADPTRPLGSFLFVGPTGVGKTETAKTLARYLFGSSARMIRFDMGEVITADAVQRFVGRFGSPGKLVSEVRRTPFSVVLLDEIEKAHPAVFDVLLQVLGEARLSDEAGRTASFRNAVVIMTSNLGAETKRAAVGFGEEDTASWSEHYVGEAKRFFRPELFNRIDHVVPFDALPSPAIRGIAERELAALAERQGFRQRGLSLEVPADVEAHLAALGTDARFGARPLKRSLEANLVGPIARHLSAIGKVSTGTVRARLEEGRVVPSFAAATGKSDAAALDALHRTVAAIGDLRLLLQGCARSPAMRALRIEVARVERLLSNPRFLKGFAELAQELRGHGDDRALVEDFDALMEHVESLEDLGYEMRFRRDTATVDDLQLERREALARLKDVGLRLAGHDLDDADRAVLAFGWSRSTEMLAAALRAYGALADGYGWAVEAFEPQKRAPENEREDGLDEVWAFEPMLDARPAEVERALRRLVPGPEDETASLVAVRFRGRHAGTLLRGEAGLHRRHASEGATSEVRVAFWDEAALAPERTDIELEALRRRGPSQLLRVINEGRRVVEDRALGIHYALEPRLEHLYERFMLARVYDSVFFEGAHRALREER